MVPEDSQSSVAISFQKEASICLSALALPPPRPEHLAVANLASVWMDFLFWIYIYMESYGGSFLSFLYINLYTIFKIYPFWTASSQYFISLYGKTSYWAAVPQAKPSFPLLPVSTLDKAAVTTHGQIWCGDVCFPFSCLHTRDWNGCHSVVSTSFFFCHTTLSCTAEVGKKRCLVLGLILLCQGRAAQECLQVSKLGKPEAYRAQEWKFGPSLLFVVD